MPWVTPISSFASFKMDKAPQLSPGERLKARRDDRQEKERAVLSSSSQGERYNAAAGSSCATASCQLGTASCLRASKMEPLRVTCPRCPALGAAGGRGSETPLNWLYPAPLSQNLAPKPPHSLRLSRLKLVPRRAEAPGDGGWEGSTAAPGTAQEEASAPGVSRVQQRHGNVLLTSLLADSRETA